MSFLKFGSTRSPQRRSLSHSADQSPFCTSPNLPQDGGIDSFNYGTIPFSLGIRSPGKSSPGRGRNMKEYEEQLGQLKKENFNLKLRIYFMEERMGVAFGPEDREHAIKNNIELKVETETLRKEVDDKKELLRQASVALDQVENESRDRFEKLRQVAALDKASLEEHVHELEKEVALYKEEFESIKELRQNEFAHGDQGEHTCVESLLMKKRISELEEQVNRLEKNLEDESERSEILERELDMVREEAARSLREEAAHRKARELDLNMQIEGKVAELKASAGRIRSLEEALSAKEPEIQIKVKELYDRDRVIEEKQSQIEQQNKVLVEIQITLDEKQRQIEALRSSVADRDNRIAELEEKLARAQANARDLQSQLEVSQKEASQLREEAIKFRGQQRKRQGGSNNVGANDDNAQNKPAGVVDSPNQRIGDGCTQQILTLPDYSHERELLRQAEERLREKDALIQRLEQAERENQRLLSELRSALSDVESKCRKSEDCYNRACKAIQGLMSKTKTLEKDNEQLRADLKKKDRRINDLGGELREVKEMFNKANWEAKQGSAVDDLKDMADEENERLWAELEEKSKKLNQITDEKNQIAMEMEKQVQALLASLRDKESQLDGLQQQIGGRNTLISELEQEINRLKQQTQVASGSETESGREQLQSAKREIEDKKQEIEALNEELKKKSANLQDLVNHELWDKNREIERLEIKLKKALDDKEQDTSLLQQQISARDLQLRLLQDKITELGIQVSLPPALITLKDLPLTSAPPGSTNTSSYTTNNVSHIHHHLLPQPLENSTNITPTASSLKEELHTLRQELQTSIDERRFLRKKVEDLKDRLRNTPERENDKKIQSLKSELSKIKEELSSAVSEKGMAESKCEASSKEMEQLKTDLMTAKKSLERADRAMHENSSLKRSLAEYSTACTLLRGRLEELAGFLEGLLRRRELSGLAPRRRQALQQAIHRSRELSHSLSESLSRSQTISFSQHYTSHIDPSLSIDSSRFPNWSLQEALDVEEGAAEELGGSMWNNKNNKNNSVTIEELNVTSSPSHHTQSQCENTSDLNSSSMLAQLNEEVEHKNRELESLRVEGERAMKLLAEKDFTISNQTNIISNLRSQLEELLLRITNGGGHLLSVKKKSDEKNASSHSSSQSFALSSCVQSETKTILGNIPAISENNSLSPPVCLSDKCVSRNSSESVKTVCCAEVKDEDSRLRSHSQSSWSPAHARQWLLVAEPQDGNKLSATNFYSTFEKEIGFRAVASETDLTKAKNDWKEDDIFNSSGEQVHLVPDDDLRHDDLLMSEIKERHSIGATMKSASPDKDAKVDPIVASPTQLHLSESEAWSEPDRRVSQARIGLNHSPTSNQSSSSRFRSAKSQNAAGESSDSEASSQDTRLQGKKGARGCEFSEVRRLRSRLRGMEQLNDALRAELRLLEASRPTTRDQSVNTSRRGSIADKATSPEVGGEGSTPPLEPCHLLEEIKIQREKLESSLLQNDLIRQQLEGAFSCLTTSKTDENLRVLCQKIQESAEQLEESHKERRDLESRLQQMTNQLVRTQEQLDSALQSKEEEIIKLQEDLADREKELDEKRVNIVDMEAKLKDRNYKLSKSQELLKTATLAQEKLHEAQKTILAVHEKASDAQSQAESLKEQLSLKITVISDLEKNVREKEKTLSERDLQILSLKDDVENRNVVIKSLEQSIAVKDKELHQLGSKYRESMEDYERRYNANVGELETKLTDICTVMTKLGEEKNRLLSERSRLEEEGRSQQTRIFELMREKKEAENEVTSLQSKMVTAEDQLSNLVADKKKLNEELSTLHSMKVENEDLKDRIVKYQKDIRSLNDSLACLQAEIEALTQSSGAKQLAAGIAYRRRGTALDGGSETTESPSQEEASALSPVSSSAFDFLAVDAAHTSLTNILDPSCSTFFRSATTRASKMSGAAQVSFSRQRSEMSDYVSDHALEEVDVVPSQPYNNYWFSVPRPSRNLIASPDLGIESDPGRLSSLERSPRDCPPVPAISEATVESQETMPPIVSFVSTEVDSIDSVDLLRQNSVLRDQLHRTTQALQSTLQQLSVSNLRKQQVEKAICKQLHRTHSVLRKARMNLQSSCIKDSGSQS